MGDDATVLAEQSGDTFSIDMSRGDPLAAIDPNLLASVVAFLQEWLPSEAKRTYRAMIEEDPEHWHRHPHFVTGIITEHALRGNGITEKVLGVRDLEEIWPSLLQRVLREEGETR